MPSKPEVIKERKKTDPEYAERLKSYSKKFREKNLESERERDRISAANKRINDRESYNAYMREWTERNKDRLNAERRERLLTDIEYAENIRAVGRARYAANPSKHRSERLRSVYGITLEDYMKMYESQKGKCAICGDTRPSKGKEGLLVDHCHTHGHVRMLLCSHCNTGLGQFRDDVQLLVKAIDYLNTKGLI